MRFWSLDFWAKFIFSPGPLESDMNSIVDTVSTWCLILLLILKPDFETPHTEFSHLVPSLDFFIGSVTVGSTVWQFQPIVLPPRILLLIIEFFIQNWSCLLPWLQPIKHAILVVGLFCAKFIFSPGLSESYMVSVVDTVLFLCLILLLILKPDFETPHTEFSPLVPSLNFFIGSLTVGSTVWQFQPIGLPPRNLLLILGFFMQKWSCLLLRLQPIKHAILIVGLLCEIHIFAWSIRIGYEFHCRHGFNMMFNHPTHAETWFRNTTYWVFSFSS